MSKLNEIQQYSDFNTVKRNARHFLGSNVDIQISTRKDKKYMIRSPDGKYIHFGQIGFQDYTKHRDEKRKELFRKRNHKWKDSPKYSPAWLSYYLLW
jgi:hypothetical protein